MLSSIASFRPSGEPLDCGPRHSAGRRSRTLCLTAVLVLAAAAAPTLLGSDAARAQSEPAIPPALQQPLPVQPGQPPVQQPPAQQPPAQQQPTQQQAPQPGAGADAGQRHGDWVQRCTPNPPPGASPPAPGEQAACFLVQTASDQNTRRPLLKITVGFFGPQRQAGAVVAMPLGIPLARGLRISVDGKEIDTVPFQVCEAEGCQAFVPMEDAMVAAFKAGTTAQASVESNQGQDFSVPISLKGFTAGFTAIQ
jgi:invasion protein IalB